jgi:hypothetical protein
MVLPGSDDQRKISVPVGCVVPLLFIFSPRMNALFLMPT